MILYLMKMKKKLLRESEVEVKANSLVLVAMGA